MGHRGAEVIQIIVGYLTGITLKNAGVRKVKIIQVRVILGNKCFSQKSARLSANLHWAFLMHGPVQHPAKKT